MNPHETHLPPHDNQIKPDLRYTLIGMIVELRWKKLKMGYSPKLFESSTSELTDHVLKLQSKSDHTEP